MKLLTQLEYDLLCSLASKEAEIINLGFSKSEDIGILHLSNALTMFEKSYVIPNYGEVLLGMCSEYRVLVVEILKRIKEEYIRAAIDEVIFPKIGKVTDEEISKILNF